MNRFSLLTLAALAIFAGCSKPGETTVVGNDGSRVTTSNDGTKVSGVDGQGNKVEWETSDKGGVQGKVTGADGKDTSYSMGGDTTVTEADLGIAFYPGATKRKEDIDSKVDSAGKISILATRFTTDDVKKVFDFYGGQSMMKSKVLAGDAGVISGENDKGAIGITVTKQDGGTVIAMTLQSK